MARGAELDVAGAVGVRIAMASNSVKINVQGNELRDAPNNRDAAKLFNGELWVDRRSLIPVAAGVGGHEGERRYTAGGLLEVGGYLANLGHGIGEWAAQGGTVTLGGKEVVAQSGSRMNLAGGTLDVAEGVINLSWLRGADGRLYEASSAPADRVYAGLYRGYEDLHGRWGEKATRRFLNPVLAPSTRREAGYTVGRDAGRLVLSAPTAVVESEIVATVYDGARQTRARAAGADSYGQSQLAVARAGGLALGNYGALGRVNVFNTDVKLGRYADITLAMAAGDALAAERVGTVWLDSGRLSDMGLGGLDLATGGALTVAEAVALADGGQVALTAGRIDAQAGITTRGHHAGQHLRVAGRERQGARAVQGGRGAGHRAARGRGAGRERPLGGPARQGRGLAVAGPARRRPRDAGLAAWHRGGGGLADRCVLGRRGAAQGRDARGQGRRRHAAGGRAGSGRRHGRAGAGGAAEGYGMAGGGSLTLETDGKVVIGGADALANRPTHTPTGAAQPQPCCSIRRCCARASRNTTSTAVTACAWPRARRWTWRCRCTDTSRAARPRASGRRRRCCWRRCTRRTRSRAR